MSKPQITFPEFIAISEKLEIKVGQVILAEKVKKSKLIKLTVDFYEEKSRTVLTNLSEGFELEDFLYKSFPFITNLEPMVQKGIESQAMIIVGTSAYGKTELQNYTNGSILL